MKKDNNIRRIGVWLDHSKAYFIDPQNGDNKIETIHSDLDTRVRHAGEDADGTLLGGYRSSNNEHHKHNREENALSKYYENLEKRLSGYEEILLFGPGSARSELHNLMKTDKQFSDKKIDVESCDQLTENQLKAKVRNHFGTV